MRRLANCGKRRSWRRRHAWRQRQRGHKTTEMIKTKKEKWKMLRIMTVISKMT